MGADVNAKTNSGNSAQDMARKYGHNDIAQLLLDHELIEASKNGDIDKVRFLLRNPKIDTEAKDVYGKNAYDWAKEKKINDIVKLIDTQNLIPRIQEPRFQRPRFQAPRIQEPRIQELEVSNKAPSFSQPLHILLLPT